MNAVSRVLRETVREAGLGTVIPAHLLNDLMQSVQASEASLARILAHQQR